jgi:hypothetical protein
MEKQNFLKRIIGGMKERFGPVHYKAPEKPSVDVEKFLAAIAKLETGGIKGDPSQFSKYSGNPKLGDDIGTYQITEGNLKTYGPRYFGGETLNKRQFMASSTAPRRYMENMLKYYTEKGYTPPQIADIHRRGYSKSGAPGSTIYQSPEYVKKFNEHYNTKEMTQ